MASFSLRFRNLTGRAITFIDGTGKSISLRPGAESQPSTLNSPGAWSIRFTQSNQPMNLKWDGNPPMDLVLTATVPHDSAPWEGRFTISNPAATSLNIRANLISRADGIVIVGTVDTDGRKTTPKMTSLHANKPTVAP